MGSQDRAIPRWGWVTARPHEFLVHLRGGTVIHAAQGGSCFKRPTDAVARVDTSLQRLQFTADQVTLEKTGVQVTGLAVFRVVEPLLAYRMLDWADGGDAHVDILREMLLGATRRLVANLTLDACLTRRKDALAAELLAEIAPVVGGTGAAEDGTSRGWGLAMDTIEIQDVRVLSEDVFASLQAPYREGLALSALRARDEVAREEALLAHASRQVAERHRSEQLALEEARRAAERVRAMDDERHAAEVARRRHEAELARDQARAAFELERDRAAADARRSGALADAETESTVAGKRAEAERIVGEAQAAAERALRIARDTVSDARLREILLTDTLPDVARAYAESFDRIVVTGATDLSILGQGVAQVLATADALGFPIGRSPPRSGQGGAP